MLALGYLLVFYKARSVSFLQVLLVILVGKVFHGAIKLYLDISHRKAALLFFTYNGVSVNKRVSAFYRVPDATIFLTTPSQSLKRLPFSCEA